MILVGTLIYVAGVFFVLFYMHTTKQHGCYEKYLRDKEAVRSDLIAKYDISALSADECNGIVYNLRRKLSKDHKAGLLEAHTNIAYTDCLLEQFEQGRAFDATLKIKLFEDIGDSTLAEAAKREMVEIEIDSTRACENLNL